MRFIWLLMMCAAGQAYAQDNENTVILQQVGPESRAVVKQSGERNTLILNQNNDNPDFQKAIAESPFSTLGRANTAIVNQFGQENALTDGNSASVTQSGTHNSATFKQKGVKNTIDVDQQGKHNSINRQQSGPHNKIRLRQNEEKKVIIGDKPTIIEQEQ